MYVHRKNQYTGIYRFGTIQAFRHPLEGGGLGIYPLRLKGTTAFSTYPPE